MAINVSLKAITEDTAASLGRLIGGADSPAKVTAAVDAKTFTIPRILDLVLDDETLRDWFLYIGAKTDPVKPAEWRRVDTVSSSNVVCIQNFVDNIPVANDLVQMYSILTPDQWRKAVNVGLGNLYFEDRVEVTLASGQNLYTPTATWLQSKGQILRYLFRDISSGATNIIEESVAVIRPIEDDNGLSFYLPSVPASIANMKLVIVARHPYEILATDAATTTCPTPLLKAQAKWEALNLIYEYLGSARAKQLYGMTMVLAEQDLHKQRARWMPMATFQDIRDEEPWQGIDTSGIPTEWNW